MQLDQLQMNDNAASKFHSFAAPVRSAGPREVLEEVLGLLEDYGPMFYTEELHNRIVAALVPSEM